MQIGLRKNGNEGFYYRDEDRKICRSYMTSGPTVKKTILQYTCLPKRSSGPSL